MKKLLVVLALFMAAVVFAQSQKVDLGELARKEKARRAEIEKQGKKGKVYTKEDVERVKDKLALEQGSTQTAPGEEAGDAGNATNYLPTEDQLKAAADREEERQQVQSQLNDLQNKKDELQQKVDELKSKTAGGYLSVNPALTLQQGQDYDAQMKDIDRQIENLQQELQDLDRSEPEKQ